ncbi:MULTISPECIES: carbon-nitrogen hydrolase family protein [unclassified Luteococcus]|uniref:carbon-nitrogen hydrolase family protein n=1 Tax=unclassified Luteococcus TaxID=2639923 RepID=UPI00313F1B1A
MDETTQEPTQPATLRVALAQLNATDDPRQNLALVRDRARQAAEQGARLVVFPEATMANFTVDPRTVAEPLDGPFADGIREIARECGALLVVGVFTPAADGRVHNTLLVTDGGPVDERYDKIHLYDAFRTRESKTVAPGQRLVVIDALGTRIGLATCYDVRFAAQFTELGRQGAELICLPASWQDGPRKSEQWELLVRSRAMDAQAILLAADQAAQDTGGKKPLGVGHSLVAGPLGEVLAQAGDQAQLLVADLDLSVVAKAREAVPILR